MARTDVNISPTDKQDERLSRSEVGNGFLASLADQARSSTALPVVIGLILIWAFFGSVNINFLSPLNLSNLLMQMTATGVIALGVVLVLLLGEIDLSVGSVSGLSSAIFGALAMKLQWPVPASIAVALAAGLLIGLIYAVILLKFGVPSFVITLAGLLSFLGLLLLILGSSGSLNLGTFNNSFLVWFGQAAYMPQWLAYMLVLAGTLVFMMAKLQGNRRRRNANLSAPSTWITVSKSVAIGLLLAAIVFYLYMPFADRQSRGIGWMFVFFLSLVIFVQYLLQRTKWGRSVYAIGGNREAARRAGINVTWTVTSVFMACSTLAAAGGMLAAGRLGTSTTSAGQGGVELTAIAAAVIGGTSLFGGHGFAWSAVLGIFVIQSITSGLDLMSLSSSWKFIITGIVLLLAVILDALTRQRRAKQGRA